MEESKPATSYHAKMLCQFLATDATFSLYQERSPSPEIEFDNLEKFVMEPATQGLTVKCRVTRDQRGMDKNFYPLYYLHLDNDKKVRGLGVTVLDWEMWPSFRNRPKSWTKTGTIEKRSRI